MEKENIRDIKKEISSKNSFQTNKKYVGSYDMIYYAYITYYYSIKIGI